MRRLLLCTAILGATLASAASAGAASAGAASPRACASADLRYAFMPGGPKSFGVFGLTVAGGTCSTAHRVAKAWSKAYEANLAAGKSTRPRSAAGFAFVTLPSKQAQELRERGRRGSTTIRFDYRVPSG